MSRSSVGSFGTLRWWECICHLVWGSDLTVASGIRLLGWTSDSFMVCYVKNTVSLSLYFYRMGSITLLTLWNFIRIKEIIYVRHLIDAKWQMLAVALGWRPKTCSYFRKVIFLFGLLGLWPSNQNKKGVHFLVKRRNLEVLERTPLFLIKLFSSSLDEEGWRILCQIR